MTLVSQVKRERVREATQKNNNQIKRNLEFD
jgi:hypothetical protein